jgi:hypothetical protein
VMSSPSETFTASSAKGTEPKRVQRRRVKGWRMPANTVYVGRPGPFGNHVATLMNKMTRPWAVKLFRSWVDEVATEEWLEAVRRELRGKNLACWCPLDQPCHADVLLEIANNPIGARER